MDPLIALGVLFWIVVIGLGVWSSFIDKARAARVLADVASRFGLKRTSQGARGRHAGVHVEVLQSERYAGGAHQKNYTLVRAFLEPELDLGLGVRSRDGDWRWFGDLGSHHGIGDPALDRVFVFGGDEPHRVTSLFREPARSALLDGAKAPGGPQLIICDRSVELRQLGVRREEFFAWAIPMVVRIAHSLQTTRRHVPLGVALGPFADACRAAAEALGLVYTATPPGIHGTMEGCAVRVDSYRQAKCSYSARAAAVFPSALGCGFWMRPTRSVIGVERMVANDIELDDPPFDDLFIVGAADAVRAKHVLSPEVRAELQALADAAPVVLTDHALELRLQGIPDPRALTMQLRKLGRVAALIHGRASRVA